MLRIKYRDSLVKRKKNSENFIDKTIQSNRINTALINEYLCNYEILSQVTVICTIVRRYSIKKITLCFSQN